MLALKLGTIKNSNLYLRRLKHSLTLSAMSDGYHRFHPYQNGPAQQKNNCRQNISDASPFFSFSCGLEVSDHAPYRVLAIDDLTDPYFSLQGMSKYSNPAVMPGDQVISIAGKSVEHHSLQELHGLLRGHLHSTVKIVLARQHDISIKYKITVLRQSLSQVVRDWNAYHSQMSDAPDSFSLDLQKFNGRLAQAIQNWQNAVKKWKKSTQFVRSKFMNIELLDNNVRDATKRLLEAKQEQKTQVLADWWQNMAMFPKCLQTIRAVMKPLLCKERDWFQSESFDSLIKQNEKWIGESEELLTNVITECMENNAFMHLVLTQNLRDLTHAVWVYVQKPRQSALLKWRNKNKMELPPGFPTHILVTSTRQITLGSGLNDDNVVNINLREQEAMVKSEHVWIGFEDNLCVMVSYDCESGTLLNDKRVLEGSTYVLDTGDEITLGGEHSIYKFRVTLVTEQPGQCLEHFMESKKEICDNDIRYPDECPFGDSDTDEDDRCTCGHDLDQQAQCRVCRM